MLQLLCCGDIAITGENLPTRPWPRVEQATPDVETRVLFNWELPVGLTANAAPRSRGPRLLANPHAVQTIENWAPGVAALATNHILDAQEAGLADTLAALRAAGFQTTGAGSTPAEIRQPFIYESSAGRLGILNWVFPETHPEWQVVPGPNCWPGLDAGRQIIQDLKREVDWILVFPHWGDECFPYPTHSDREIARGLIEAGADVIVGHHPHVVRGLELIQGKPVFYSLGNFYFSDTQDRQGRWVVRMAPRNREALVVRLTFDRGQAPSFEALSYWQAGSQTNADPRQRAVRRMRTASQPLEQLAGDAYLGWYQKRRKFFNRWEYRVHFSLWQKGWGSLLRYPLTLLTRAQRGG